MVWLGQSALNFLMYFHALRFAVDSKLIFFGCVKAYGQSGR
jgi:hypothetical protein